MLRASLRLIPPLSNSSQRSRPLRATLHRSPWRLHPSKLTESRYLFCAHALIRLARLFRSRDPSSRQAKFLHHRLRASTRHRRPESHSGVRGLISRTVHEVLSNPTCMFCAVCILVVGLGAHALASEVERIKTEFKEGVKDLWRGVENLPGRAVEGVKAVARKGGSRIRELKEAAIRKAERVVGEWRVKRVEEERRGKDGVVKALKGTLGRVNGIFRRDAGGRDGEGGNRSGKANIIVTGEPGKGRSGVSGKGTGNSKVKTEEWLREKQKRIKSEREGP